MALPLRQHYLWLILSYMPLYLLFKCNLERPLESHCTIAVFIYSHFRWITHFYYALQLNVGAVFIVFLCSPDLICGAVVSRHLRYAACGAASLFSVKSVSRSCTSDSKPMWAVPLLLWVFPAHPGRFHQLFTGLTCMCSSSHSQLQYKV